MSGKEEPKPPHASLAEPAYPQILPPAAQPEPLPEVLGRTGFRASLSPEYLEGRAPEAQRRADQEVDPAPSYYGLPAIKKPDWDWYVPAYFVTGGIAAGAYIIAAAADMGGREEDRPLVRAGRLTSLAALALCPPLLIADLGRPERFHHMLRVFRPRSMMNQGSWGISIFGAFVGLTTLMEAAAILSERGALRGTPEQGCLPISRHSPALDLLPEHHANGGPALAPRSPVAALLRNGLRAATWVGVIPAAFVGSYTGVLLSATNVPLWAGNRYFLGPLFFTSALSSGAASTHLTARMLGPVSEHSEERLHRVETAALAAEGVLTAASLTALGNLGKPLHSGRMSMLFKVGYIGLGLVAPLALRQAGRRRPWLGLAASVLSAAGAAALKFAMTEAGKESADDPHAYFEYTRGAGEE